MIEIETKDDDVRLYTPDPRSHSGTNVAVMTTVGVLTLIALTLILTGA